MQKIFENLRNQFEMNADKGNKIVFTFFLPGDNLTGIAISLKVDHFCVGTESITIDGTQDETIIISVDDIVNIREEETEDSVEFKIDLKNEYATISFL